MANSEKMTGSCLCKAVTLQANTGTKAVGACHCSSCRNWAGGPLLAVDCGTEVSFNDDAPISVFNSSEWAERGFCSKCGTHLFYRMKQSQQYIVPVGVFVESNGFEFDHQIFVDEKPDFYDFSNNTKNMTGAEVFAQYTPDA